ncbi:hypothetical protein PSHT_08190 [Puccinia striiformis]|uniref:Uncharacterized protein n=1 Tax=Puccinia striiformis TaxID=27350 RepID=A0A2S4VRM6_9BASI|nr:hypothetical protein PSHT_08190 [Puccinia striiformis]
MIASLEGFQQTLFKQIHFGGTQSGKKDFFQPFSDQTTSSKSLHLNDPLSLS